MNTEKFKKQQYLDYPYLSIPDIDEDTIGDKKYDTTQS